MFDEERDYQQGLKSRAILVKSLKGWLLCMWYQMEVVESKSEVQQE